MSDQIPTTTEHLAFVEDQLRRCRETLKQSMSETAALRAELDAERDEVALKDTCIQGMIESRNAMSSPTAVKLAEEALEAIPQIIRSNSWGHYDLSSIIAQADRALAALRSTP